MHLVEFSVPSLLSLGHPIFSHIMIIASFRAQVRAQPVKHATRVPVSRATTVPSYASLSRERSGMRSAGMMQARPPVSLMHRPRKSPDMEEIHPTRLEITTSNNYKVGTFYFSLYRSKGMYTHWNKLCILYKGNHI